MKTQLIKLPECNIIVSDEEIKDSDYHIDLELKEVSNKSLKYEMMEGNDSFFKKIIASTNSEYNLLSIDYNGFEEKLGIVDVQKLANKSIDSHYGAPEAPIGSSARSYWETQIIGFIEGFKKAQELSDKKFSLEDMYMLSAFVTDFIAGRKGDFITTTPKDVADKYIQSLQQPKIFDIETEMESYGTTDFLDAPVIDYRPKITNNKIKIIKIL